MSALAQILIDPAYRPAGGRLQAEALGPACHDHPGNHPDGLPHDNNVPRNRNRGRQANAQTKHGKTEGRILFCCSGCLVKDRIQ